MDEYTSPLLEPPAATGNLSDIIVLNAAQAPHKVVFRRKAGDRWLDVTCSDFLSEVQGVAKGLMASGVGAGDRVGLMARTRYEWTLIDFAIWTVGGVTVPIYETSSAEQVQWILGDSGAVACVVEAPEHAAVLDEVKSSLSALRNTWTIDTGAVDELTSAGTEISDEDLEARRTTAQPDDLATIIYTSGTTGRPKGCELTHGNFLFEAANVISGRDPDATLAQLFLDENASTLLFLPLAHVFARMIQVGVVMARSTLGHTSDVKRLLDDLASFQPTFILSVPRVFEKVYNSSEQKAEAAGKGKIFHAAAATAIAYSEAQDHGGAGIGLKAKHALFDKLVYTKLRAALGGRVRWAVSGGAALGGRLGHFYRGIGLIVLEGYGLTETTAATTVNTPGMIKIGTVGRPLAGVSVRIAEDGEVLIKGGQVFRGYYNNPEATAEAFTDGWFRSGDLGELDNDGCLRITGRKKEIIVTAGGKNVAPAVLEDRLRAHRLISQCIVVGDAQPYIACLVTLDAEALPAWAEQRGKGSLSVHDAASDPDLLAEIQGAVDEANKAVSRAEAIKKFKVLPVDWTEESGALTPSMKLKRGVVLKEHAAEVDALYS
ncbi:MAG TPA: AMP-dependent synthetase/ligase [Actinomycetes bacterium]|nr:AMP-dependent synthetase/ligase [Actinomycetes bacterium]